MGTRKGAVELTNKDERMKCKCGEVMALEHDGYGVEYFGGVVVWMENVPQHSCGICELVYVTHEVLGACRQQIFLQGGAGE